MDKESISLSQLTFQIKAAISASFSDTRWVVAEIQEMNVNRNGHCYLELVEKDEKGDRILAKCRATIWGNTFRVLKPYFESVTGYKFEAGIKVLFSVSVAFHELYGLSLNIRDVDPNYTLGDFARRKQEIIAQLEADGVINLNKEVAFPELPQRIAIISSPTAAGLGDFMDQLANNEFGFVFYTKLFPAIMQGNQTEESVIWALEKVFQHEAHFDLVVIIRGGGAKSDLAAFDQYELALNVAQFPLPVLAGIGHERDESIVDLVAHKALKTPTAVAEFILHYVDELATQVLGVQQELQAISLAWFQNNKTQVEQLSARLLPLVQNSLATEKAKIQRQESALKLAALELLNRNKGQHAKTARVLAQSSQKHLESAKQKLNRAQWELKRTSLLFLDENKGRLNVLLNSLKHLDPVNTLKRGYSITFSDGVLLCSSKNIEKGKVLVTRFADGEVNSTVG